MSSLYCNIWGPFGLAAILMLNLQFLCGVDLLHMVLQGGHGSHGICFVVPVHCAWVWEGVDLVSGSARHCFVPTSIRSMLNR